MNSNQLDHIRDRLGAEQRQLAAAWLAATGEHDALVTQPATDAPTGGNGDASISGTGADLGAAGLGRLRQRLHQVNHALARLDAGDYGRCEDCGQPIPEQRLLVMPTATTCVPCQTAREQQRP